MYATTGRPTRAASRPSAPAPADGDESPRAADLFDDSDGIDGTDLDAPAGDSESPHSGEGRQPSLADLVRLASCQLALSEREQLEHLVSWSHVDIDLSSEELLQ